MSKIKTLTMYVLIFVVAVTSGVAIGNIYVGTLTPSVDMSNITEALIRDDEDETVALYNNAVSGKKTTFTAVELYNIAEYKLRNTTSYVKLMSGKVDTVIKQKMQTTKLVTEDGITYIKLSPSSSSLAPTIATKISYDASNPDEVVINNSGSISGEYGSYVGTFDEAKNETWSMDYYEEIFNTGITTPLQYIVSSITCGEGNYDTTIKAGSDGNYTFTITMTGTYANYSALYYMYEVGYCSGYDAIPTFSSVTITGVVDSNFNFVSLDYVENYTLDIGILATSVTDYFTEYFYYDEETISSYMYLR